MCKFLTSFNLSPHSRLGHHFLVVLHQRGIVLILKLHLITMWNCYCCTREAAYMHVQKRTENSGKAIPFEYAHAHKQRASAARRMTNARNAKWWVCVLVNTRCSARVVKRFFPWFSIFNGTFAQVEPTRMNDQSDRTLNFILPSPQP